MNGSTRLARLKYHTKYCAVQTYRTKLQDVNTLRLHASNTESVRCRILLPSQQSVV